MLCQPAVNIPQKNEIHRDFVAVFVFVMGGMFAI